MPILDLIPYVREDKTVPDAKSINGQIKGLLQEFAKEFQPLEPLAQLLELVDSRTGARYCECHIKGEFRLCSG